ncbi:MAG: hypothetical protein JNL04_04275 [Rhodospirillaceae bacterium]|nr:hypothetical protein [Rhodospirillaceae bacterium]
MKRITLPTLLAVAAVSLGACGYSQGDRALSGAAIGAGAGAVGGAVLGGDPVAGALIGGAGGAAIGAFTDPKQLNLGRPAWR